MLDDDVPTTNGLLECLRMLADEASSMQLTRTSAALQEAMAACRAEASASLGRPVGITLH